MLVQHLNSWTALIRSISFAALAYNQLLNHEGRVSIKLIHEFRMFFAEIKIFTFQRETPWTHESALSILAPYDSKTFDGRVQRNRLILVGYSWKTHPTLDSRRFNRWRQSRLKWVIGNRLFWKHGFSEPTIISNQVKSGYLPHVTLV